MDTESFAREFGAELSNGSGALFVGAGISKPSGVPDWYQLIRPLASSRLGLHDLADSDLVQVAQYIVNAGGGNRGALIHQLRSQFSGPFSANGYHQALVQTQVSTLWTTNYDVLLEQAFRQASFSVDVKATDDSISRSVPNHEIEIIKMHGSIDQSPHRDLVITAEDYEDFEVHRPATSERLRTDLLSRSFLFLGYSYRDPNIHTIMAQARRLSDTATRQHFLITTEEAPREDDKPGDIERRQLMAKLWSDNLRRFGIETITLPGYDGVQPLLSQIARKSRGRTVYVVGSHLDSGNTAAKELGRLLADQTSLTLIDGQSEGVGREVITAFVEAGIHKKRDVYKHLKLFPNPYSVNPAFENDSTQLPLLKSWRAPLLRSTHVFVCFDGGMGTKAELEAAMQSNCRIVPVPGKPDGLVLTSVLKDATVTKNLPADYVSKAQAGRVSAAEVVGCIEELMR